MHSLIAALFDTIIYKPYTFPTPADLAEAGEGELRRLGLGFGFINLILSMLKQL